MREVIERHWTSYFYSGSIALIVSWVLMITLSGCRFGNHEVDPNLNIGMSGYYSTRPVANVGTVYLATGTTLQSNISVTNVVPDISNYFTDPTTLVLADSSNGIYSLIPPGQDPSKGLAISVSASGKAFSITNGDTGWQTFWTDDLCKINFSSRVQGSINPLGPGDLPAVNTSVGTVNLLGRLAGKVTLEETFQGDCSATWSSMRDCYGTLSSCPGSTSAVQLSFQNSARYIYNYWVELGVMKVSDIGSASDLRFDVTYQ